MLALALARALASSVLRNPLLWCLAGATFALRWVVDLTFELGLTVDGVHELAASYELAFMGGCLAVALTLAAAVRHAAVLQPASATARIGAPIVAGLLAAAVPAAASIVPAHWSREWQPVPFDADASRTALVLGWAHLTAIGLAVRPALDPTRPPSGRTETAAALAPLAVGLLAPAALGEGASFMRQLVDVSAPLQASFDLSAPGAHLTPALLSIVFWTALAAIRSLPRASLAAPSAAPTP